MRMLSRAQECYGIRILSVVLVFCGWCITVHASFYIFHTSDYVLWFKKSLASLIATFRKGAHEFYEFLPQNQCMLEDVAKSNYHVVCYDFFTLIHQYNIYYFIPLYWFEITPPYLRPQKLLLCAIPVSAFK